MTRRNTKAELKLVSIENILAGTELHLGDGRRLAFGEAAPVREEIAALIDPRQATKRPL